MNKVKAFLASKNISAHTFAVAAVGLVGLYVSDPAVKAYVDPLVADHPNAVKLLGVAVALYARYSHSSKEN